MGYDSRLCGGPFDGDKGSLDVPPPAVLWVEPCRQCGTHWYSEWSAGCEKYRRDAEEDGVTVYIFEDSNLSGGGRLTTSEKQPNIKTNKELEPV